MSKWQRYPGDRSYRKDHRLMAGHLFCKMCGSGYVEDEPADKELEGYCSEECARKDRQIDKADATDKR